MIKYLNLIVILVLLAPFTASADTDTINPTDDSYVWYHEPDTNYGYLNALVVGFNDGQMCPVIKFDLSGYSGTTINNAELNLYVYSIGGIMNEFTIARHIADWDENLVTWNNRPDIDDYFIIGEPSYEDWWQIDVTGWVQDVADGTHDNCGWRLTGTGALIHIITIFSKEEPSDKPYLSIDYTPSAIESSTLGEIKAAFK